MGKNPRTIAFRVSENEHRGMVLEAKALEMSLSEYLRSVLSERLEQAEQYGQYLASQGHGDVRNNA